MDSAPDSPVSATTVMVSLWQANMVGVRAERFITWLKARTGSVQYLSGVTIAPTFDEQAVMRGCVTKKKQPGGCSRTRSNRRAQLRDERSRPANVARSLSTDARRPAKGRRVFVLQRRL